MLFSLLEGEIYAHYIPMQGSDGSGKIYYLTTTTEEFHSCMPAPHIKQYKFAKKLHMIELGRIGH